VRFRDLSFSARVFIVGIMLAGGALAAASPSQGAFARPLLLLLLVAASIAAHTIKIALPAGSSYSTMSVGFAVTFAAMLVLGPAASVWAMLAAGWAQCTLNTKQPNPWYRTAFSMSVLALSMQSAAQVLAWSGGSTLSAPADVVIPAIVAAALAYFLVNSILMAAALGLTTGRSILRTWDQEFLWGAPNYFIGALAATVAVEGVRHYGVWAVVMVVAPLVLTFRLYRVYLGRVDDISRANKELHSLYERAHAESLTDPLTELPNRRFLASHAFSEIARAAREGYEVAFLLADVDDFKAINDTYGHPEGDAVLRLVAAYLRRGLRPYDVCGRYAGDEFVLILSRCSAALAERRAAELVESLADARRGGDGGGKRRLSISIGCAVFPDDGATYEALLAAADARMYENKHRRNHDAVR
jgi:diguanylate cyclase (GGDEF)-like protein